MHPARVLVAYCTRSGSTAGVAGSIAARLREHGHAVDRHELPDAPGPHDYDAIVLGSPVFDGRWLPEAEAYVWQHRAELRTHQLWLFSVGTFGDTKRLLGSLARREPRNIDALLTALRPRDYRVFAGAIEPAAWPWWSRMLLRAIGGASATTATGRSSTPGRRRSPADSSRRCHRTTEAPRPRGFSEYRHGDSNPGFRRERAAS